MYINTAAAAESVMCSRASGRSSAFFLIFRRCEPPPTCGLLSSRPQLLNRKVRGLPFSLQPWPRHLSSQQGYYLEQRTKMRLSQPTVIPIFASMSAWTT